MCTNILIAKCCGKGQFVNTMGRWENSTISIISLSERFKLQLLQHPLIPVQTSPNPKFCNISCIFIIPNGIYEIRTGSPGINLGCSYNNIHILTSESASPCRNIKCCHNSILISEMAYLYKNAAKFYNRILISKETSTCINLGCYCNRILISKETRTCINLRCYCNSILISSETPCISLWCHFNVITKAFWSITFVKETTFLLVYSFDDSGI